MGGKTELTTIKTLMEITGQNKEDVQSVLQKFGGDEALAVSELMCSACNHHLSYFNFSRAGGKIIVREALCGIITRAKTDPLRLFFPKLQCMHKFVDVKTKKSKEVRVDAFFARECASGDRFRDFFLVVFLHSASSRRHSFACKRGIPLFSARFFLSSVTRAQYSACTLFYHHRADDCLCSSYHHHFSHEPRY